MLIRSVVLGLAFASLGLPQAADPKPKDATRGILEAFDTFEVVGMHSAHGGKDVDDFILSLIRDPQFAAKVNDIVVECGNSRYQPLLDRYIAGEDVSLKEVQPVWRDTTQLMCSLSAFYAELFPLVRAINQKLPANERLRVLAGDPAFDWATVTSRSDVPIGDRDFTIASVMKTEVLSRKRKALMLFGLMHLLHGLPASPPAEERTMRATAVTMYEQSYPGLTFVVIPHRGFGTFSHLEADNTMLEARLKSWPEPSLVPLKGTWLGDLGAAYFFEVPASWRQRPVSSLADAYLYLGPLDSLHAEPASAEIRHDDAFMSELLRRKAIGGTSFSAFDPAAIR
jgi:hypothetical protein